MVFELGQLLRGETRKEGVPQTAQIHLLLLLHAVAAVPGELFHFHRQRGGVVLLLPVQGGGEAHGCCGLIALARLAGNGIPYRSPNPVGGGKPAVQLRRQGGVVGQMGRLIGIVPVYVQPQCLRRSPDGDVGVPIPYKGGRPHVQGGDPPALGDGQLSGPQDQLQAVAVLQRRRDAAPVKGNLRPQPLQKGPEGHHGAPRRGQGGRAAEVQIRPVQAHIDAVGVGHSHFLLLHPEVLVPGVPETGIAPPIVVLVVPVQRRPHLGVVLRPVVVPLAVRPGLLRRVLLLLGPLAPGAILLVQAEFGVPLRRQRRGKAAQQQKGRQGQGKSPFHGYSLLSISFSKLIVSLFSTFVHPPAHFLQKSAPLRCRGALFHAYFSSTRISPNRT